MQLVLKSRGILQAGRFLKSKQAAVRHARCRRTSDGRGLDGNGKTKTQGLRVISYACMLLALLPAQIPSQDETTQHGAIWRGTGTGTRKAHRVDDVPIKKAPDYSEIRAESKEEGEDASSGLNQQKLTGSR